MINIYQCFSTLIYDRMTGNWCVLERVPSRRENAKTRNRREIINMIKSDWQMTGNSRRNGLAVGVQTRKDDRKHPLE